MQVSRQIMEETFLKNDEVCNQIRMNLDLSATLEQMMRCSVLARTLERIEPVT